MTKKLTTRKIIAIIVVFFTMMFVSSVSAAYDFGKNSGIKEIASSSGYGNTQSPEYYIGQILTLVFSFVGVIFLALIIYAGIHWMTAQGNSSQVEKAKDTIIKSIVGLVIIMVAYAITIFIMNFLNPPAPVFIDSPIDTPPSDINPFEPPQA